jgi:hypothetical protein
LLLVPLKVISYEAPLPLPLPLALEVELELELEELLDGILFLSFEMDIVRVAVVVSRRSG